MHNNDHLRGICRVAPLPKVAKSIRREIQANRLTASDIRFRSLAANMAIERPRRRVGLNDGDAADPYPGSKSNTTFDDKSKPNSRDYFGDATNVEVGSIRQLVKGSIKCRVKV